MQMTRTCLHLALAIGFAGCFPEVEVKGANTAKSGNDPGGSDGDPSADGTDRCTGYIDADGDGFGTGDSVTHDCEDDTYAAVDGDCDDSDPLVRPDVSERCNGIDDDCDGTTDEELSYDWYADGDGDGYGDGESLNDCDPPAGSVDVAGDCDDSRADVNPEAVEVCNGVDDDCNSQVDDEDGGLDLSSAATWYRDADGDTFGDESDSVAACDVPGDGYVADSADCDDTAAEVNPDASEVCDRIDNDCDGAIDDDDDSRDPESATEWHADADGDSYGAEAVAITCVAPSGTVADSTDCDDDDRAVNPAALEVCNDIDDNCDELIDDADPSVDTSTGKSFYTDADRDTYGDPDTEVAFCANPGGLVTDATDCDDDNRNINPAATEICNSVDDDCDRDIDDDDSSLDLSTADTWYVDDDRDGLGTTVTTTVACEAPSGYADNPDDCDDSGFDDYDGDLLQDCEDPDADGDGLSSTYDVDDLDDALVRGPTGGFGGDGALTYSSGIWSAASDYTRLASSVSAGDSSISVGASAPFAAGDEIIVADLQGADAGQFGYHFVTSVSGYTLQLEPPLTNDYDATDVVVVQRVPHYTTVSITGTLSPDPWDGFNGGGLVVFRATGAVQVSGSIDVAGMGYLGGNGVVGNSYDAYSGGTYSGGPVTASSYGYAVDGGGGTTVAYADLSLCGGGGAYGTDGEEGAYSGGYVPYSGGGAYGDTDLATWFFGSGGGGGAPDSESDGSSSDNVTGDGGSGGGIIAMYSADSVTVSGSLSADGADGGAASWGSITYWTQGEIGGGGGGAGGQSLIAADIVRVTGSASAVGGDGGRWRNGILSYVAYGGDGGDGRVRVEYGTILGLSDVEPTASVGSFVD